VFVGFDEPQTLGGHETGGSIAAPIFRDFMAEALADTPAMPFRMPRGIRLVRIDHDSGQPAEPGQKGAILEAFKADSLPVAGHAPILGSEDTTAATAQPPGYFENAPTTVGGGPVTPVRAAPAPAMGGLY